MATKDRPQIKDDELYEALRRDGTGKEKAARIANAAASSGRKAVGRKGGKSSAYEEWTLDELKEKASEVGLEGRSKMSKGDLIRALRHH